MREYPSILRLAWAMHRRESQDRLKERHVGRRWANKRDPNLRNLNRGPTNDTQKTNGIRDCYLLRYQGIRHTIPPSIAVLFMPLRFLILSLIASHLARCSFIPQTSNIRLSDQPRQPCLPFPSQR
jgi:hypothetical protein